ncbi:MAG: dTDP-4-dehydrorhamnose 3,5-epimerase family protein, partial [Syntrophothermus sp.]
MIDGVKIKQLKVIPDERGRLMEMLRADDDIFQKFGQVYMTTAYPGVVKAWHYHKKQTDNFVVVKGMMKIVLYDSREGSPTKGEVNEFFMGEHRQILLQIPPLVYHGFKCISETEAMVINTP